MKFFLELDLTDHLHPENPAAQRAKVRELLGLAIQAVGSNSNRRGDLTIPIYDPNSNTGRRAVIGSWKFTEDETRTVASEAAPPEPMNLRPVA